MHTPCFLKAFLTSRSSKKEGNWLVGAGDLKKVPSILYYSIVEPTFPMVTNECSCQLQHYSSKQSAILSPFRLKVYVRWNSWKSESSEYFPLLSIKTSTFTLLTCIWMNIICEWEYDSDSKIARRDRITRWINQNQHVRTTILHPHSSSWWCSQPVLSQARKHNEQHRWNLSCWKEGKNLVRNLKQDNNSDETIFHELSVLFPQHGCPLTLYTTKDMDYMTAHRSQNALLREANDVLCNANSEFANKRRCIKTKRAARLLQTLSSSLTSCPPATSYSFIKGKHNNLQQSRMDNTWVWNKICPHQAVIAVHGPGGSILYNVEYVESTAGNIAWTEKAVPLYRLTAKRQLSMAWGAAEESVAWKYATTIHTATSAIDNIVDNTSCWNKARQAPENNPFCCLPIWDVQRLESARDGISHFSWETK